MDERSCIEDPRFHLSRTGRVSEKVSTYRTGWINCLIQAKEAFSKDFTRVVNEDKG